MNSPLPSWSVQKPCDESIPWLQQRLAAAGLRYLQTFDLHDARLAATDCTCPRHGTMDCDCRMVVLLVYADPSPPVTLVVHGNDGHIWISVIDRPGQRADPGAILAIKRALRIEAANEV